MDALLGLFWLLATWLGGADHDPECLVLGGLDVVRAQAFVSGDEAGLHGVYVDRRAASTDARVLRSYRSRGLRLEGMLLVRESCRMTERSQGRVVLDVVDRLGPTQVQTEDGARLDLPRDRATRRTVVLRKTGAEWRIAEIRPG